MTDDLFLKYPYEDEEDYLTESDFCELQDNKESFEDNWFYTQDDFEDYSDESEYLIGLPSDHEGVIKSNNLFFTHDKKDNVCYVMGFVEDASEELVIPEEVNGTPVIGIVANAFAFNQKLRSVELPRTVVHISSFAFIGCIHLQTVKLGATQMHIGKSAFYRCHSLHQVLWDDSLSSWLRISFENEFSNPLRCGAELSCNGEKIEDLIIPDDTVVIPQGAFSGCSSIKSVWLSRNVKRIGRASFAFCEKLETVELCDFCAFSIFREAFFNCFSLNSVCLDGCFAIGSYAFGNCHSLKPNDFKEHHFMYISDEALKGVENE